MSVLSCFYNSSGKLLALTIDVLNINWSTFHVKHFLMVLHQYGLPISVLFFTIKYDIVVKDI